MKRFMRLVSAGLATAVLAAAPTLPSYAFSASDHAGLATAMLAVAPTGLVVAGTCPAPLPNCTSKGTLTNLSGQFGCTGIETGSTGNVEVEVILVNSDGAGNLTSIKIATNQTMGTGATFQDFQTVTGATYCLNTDNTGFIFLPAVSGDCPLALVIDSTNKEGRLIGTSNNKAEAVVCRQQ